MKIRSSSDFGGVSGKEVTDTASKITSTTAAAVNDPAVAKAAASHPAVAAAIASHPGVQAFAPHVAATASQHAAAGGYSPGQAPRALAHPAVKTAAQLHPAVAQVLGSHPAAPPAVRPKSYGHPAGPPSRAPQAPPGRGWGQRDYDPNAHHDTYRGYGDWVRAGRPTSWWGRVWSDWGWPWHWAGHDIHYRYRDRYGRWIPAPSGVYGWLRTRRWWPWYDVEVIYDPDYTGDDTVIATVAIDDAAYDALEDLPSQGGKDDVES